MELKGKKINFLGDSITEGHGTSSTAKRFTDLISASEGVIARNYGIGGTRFAKQSKPSEKARHDLDFCKRALEMDADADAVVVFGGTNDYGHGDAPFGSMEDRTPDTFCGAAHTLFSSLIERYPSADIVVITPLHRCNEDDPKGSRKPHEVATLKQYVEAIRAIAEYYSLPVLDLYAISGLQPEVGIIKERFIPDGLHPNDAGHEILARKITQFLKAL